MSESSDFKIFMVTLIEVCREAADLTLHQISPSSMDSLPTPAYVLIKDAIVKECGSSELYTWTNEIIATYLTESAHELNAIASLLEAGTVFASLEPLVRTAVERQGVLAWILDTDLNVGVRPRAIRAGLVYLDSLQRYKRTAEQMGIDGESRKRINADWKRDQDLFDGWFQKEYRNNCGCDPCKSIHNDVSNWVVDGQRLPSYTALTEIALEWHQIDPRFKSVAYAILCGFTHPSVIFSRELKDLSPNGEFIYFHRQKDLLNSVSLAVSCHLEGIRRWAGFMMSDETELVDRTNAIGRKMDDLPSE